MFNCNVYKVYEIRDKENKKHGNQNLSKWRLDEEIHKDRWFYNSQNYILQHNGVASEILAPVGKK